MQYVQRYLHSRYYNTNAYQETVNCFTVLKARAPLQFAWYANHMNEAFRKFSAHVSNIVGSAKSFIVAALVIVIWAITGPLFHFSNTWQLVINTGTTIVTFLMVFVIQNTQNRDARSMHLQLDELIKSMKTASNAFLDLDEMSDDELDKLRDHFRSMHDKVATHQARKRKP